MADENPVIAPSPTPGMLRDSDTRYWAGVDSTATVLPAVPLLKQPAIVPEGHLWHFRPLDNGWASYCGIHVSARPAPMPASTPRCKICSICPADRRRYRTEAD